MADERVQRRLAAILAADVVGFSRMVEADEAGTIARIRALQTELIHPLIAADGGRIVKLMGDGVLVEYGSAVDAVRNAIAIQAAMDEHNRDIDAADHIRFRVGINVGDVIIDGDDIHGDGVNVAARLEGICDPGGVYISGSVHDHVDGRLDAAFDDLGEQTVKNIARPIRVWRVRFADQPAVQVAPTSQAPASNQDKVSIAVLAFNNMSGDAEQEYFSDGISEDIITDLSKLSEIHVIARNSTFVYKGTAVSIPDVAKELGVRYVLEGSVRRAGNRVRVTAQLIDSTDGGHVWADRFDRDLTDIFEVQDELTREIVGALKLQLTSEEEDRLVHKADIDVEAYSLYLRGREQSWLHSRAGNIAARDLMDRALAIEPEYAAAMACKGFTLAIDYINGWGGDAKAGLAQGIELARRAVEIEPDEPMARFAYGGCLMWSKRLDEAVVEAEECLRLAPSLAEGNLFRAHVNIFAGHPSVAIETLENYMRLDPHYPEIVLHFLAEARISLGDFEGAIEALDLRLERNPESATAHALKASCLGNLGRIDEGRQVTDRLKRIAPDFSLGHRREILPFKKPEDLETRLQGFRELGVLD